MAVCREQQALDREQQALDDVVHEVLAAAGVVRPPVDVLQVARRLGITVAYDASQQPRGRQGRVAGRSTIFVRPDRRPERLQWTVASELGDMAAQRVADRWDIDLARVTPAKRGEIAQQLASRLLLPTPWFVERAQDVAEDLLRLKMIFATASHELLAWRLLDLPRPSVVSLFDQGRLTRRRGNQPQSPQRLGVAENWCWRQVQEFSHTCELRQAGYRIQGWPIHEPGWRREVVRLVWEVACEEEEMSFARALGQATAGILAKNANAD